MTDQKEQKILARFNQLYFFVGCLLMITTTSVYIDSYYKQSDKDLMTSLGIFLCCMIFDMLCNVLLPDNKIASLLVWVSRAVYFKVTSDTKILFNNYIHDYSSANAQILSYLNLLITLNFVAFLLLGGMGLFYIICMVDHWTIMSPKHAMYLILFADNHRPNRTK